MTDVTIKFYSLKEFRSFMYERVISLRRGWITLKQVCVSNFPQVKVYDFIFLNVFVLWTGLILCVVGAGGGSTLSVGGQWGLWLRTALTPRPEGQQAGGQGQIKQFWCLVLGQFIADINVYLINEEQNQPWYIKLDSPIICTGIENLMKWMNLY